MAVELAVRLHWTRSQILQEDPDYIDELWARLRAQSDVEARQWKQWKERLDQLGG